MRGSADVEEALGRGVREETPDAVQALDFEEALDGKTGAGQGTWKEEEYTMTQGGALHFSTPGPSVSLRSEPIIPDEISAF